MPMPRKRPHPFEAVSDDALVVLKSCFQFMDLHGTLTFENEVSVPHPRVAEALEELKQWKIVRHRKQGKTDIWSPAEGVDFRVLERVAYPKDSKFPLTIKVNSKEYIKFREELTVAVAKSKKPTKALSRVLQDMSRMSIADLVEVQSAANRLLNTK